MYCTVLMYGMCNGVHVKDFKEGMKAAGKSVKNTLIWYINRVINTGWKLMITVKDTIVF